MMRKIVSKFSSKCCAPKCKSRQIQVGEWIWWEKEYGTFHNSCAPDGKIPTGTMTKADWNRYISGQMSPEEVYEAKMALASGGGSYVSYEDEMVLTPAILAKAGATHAKNDPPPAYSQDIGKAPEPKQCTTCGKYHNEICVRCKKQIGHGAAGTVRPATQFDPTARRHCYDCWMSNQVTANIQSTQKKADSSLAAATQAISTIHLYGKIHFTGCNENVTPSTRTTTDIAAVNCEKCRKAHADAHQPKKIEEPKKEEKLDRFQLIEID